MSDELDLDLGTAQAVKLLQALMEVLYLSTACASGQHHQCRGVDKFRSLVCCCTGCGHTSLLGPPPDTAGIPLLHLAEQYDQRDTHHVYEPNGTLGVRADLVRALEKTLDEQLPGLGEESRRALAVQLGITSCLTFAPRSL
ncbi:hypothetical protein ACFVXC_05650 [Streptomyces sp. NPDC058257]|uniref:hypothetical protein n=1 Tax=Streptomyces sp. NPDC058257 TaxID=3346409 RepID=UPI0036F0E343